MRLVDGVSELIVSGRKEHRAGALADRQCGRVSRSQLLAAGLSGAAISRSIRAGYLRLVHPGVYAVGHAAPVAGGAEAAALLAARPGVALSHATALRWWAMLGDASASPGRAGEAIHVIVAGSGAVGPAGVIVHRSTILTPRDLRIHHGLPVTSPARALLDAAVDQPPRTVQRALDTGLVRRVVTFRELNELLARAGRHQGRWMLTELLLHHAGPTFTRSEAEEALLGILRDADLEQPLVNVRRHGFEIDFLWERLGIAVEIDGYAFHAGRGAFERDRRRDATLLAAGITVVRITWRRLTEEPVAVAAEIAGLLARAEATRTAAIR